MKTHELIERVLLGSAKSGNWGHKGAPGIGGSSAKGAGGAVIGQPDGLILMPDGSNKPLEGAKRNWRFWPSSGNVDTSTVASVGGDSPRRLLPKGDATVKYKKGKYRALVANNVTREPETEIGVYDSRSSAIGAAEKRLDEIEAS